MASITIRRLSEEVKQRLRERAAANKRSMEEEARHILEQATQPKPKSGADFYREIRALVEPLGGLELPEVSRKSEPRNPFADWK